MKIQLISDTHTYSYTLNSEADIIVHAGDMSNGSFKYIDEFVSKCNEIDKPYVFVLGNHDFYDQNIEDVYKYLNNKNYNYLTHGKEYTYNGYTFVGGTLWTNFHQNKLEYSDPTKFDLNKFNAKNCINDFYCIKYKNKLVTPNDYITFFNQEWNWIQKYRNKPNTIVVTHFPLHQCCLDPYWANHPTGKYLNPYFINDLDCIGFNVILSGHTHTAIDTIVNNTRFIINPFGYINEQNINGFKHNLIIEV